MHLGDIWKLKDIVWVKAQDMSPGSLALANMIYTGSQAELFGDYNSTVKPRYLGLERALSGYSVRTWVCLVELNIQWHIIATEIA
jgi:hypothetical protein